MNLQNRIPEQQILKKCRVKEYWNQYNLLVHTFTHTFIDLVKWHHAIFYGVFILREDWWINVIRME